MNYKIKYILSQINTTSTFDLDAVSKFWTSQCFQMVFLQCSFTSDESLILDWCRRHTVPKSTPDGHTNKEFEILREDGPEIGWQPLNSRSKYDS
jgi:hypothetical protein